MDRPPVGKVMGIRKDLGHVEELIRQERKPVHIIEERPVRGGNDAAAGPISASVDIF